MWSWCGFASAAAVDASSKFATRTWPELLSFSLCEVDVFTAWPVDDAIRGKLMPERATRPAITFYT